MGVHRRTRPLVGYGLDNALQSLAPQPIIAQRDPTTSDIAEIGSIWIHGATNSSWTLTSVVAGAANWEATTGGSGHFNSLTVGPGAFDVNSTQVIDIATTNSGTGAILLDASAAGGIDIFAAKEIEIRSTVDSGPSVAIISDGGTLDTVYIQSVQGTGSAAVLLLASAGGVSLTGNKGVIISNDSTGGGNILIDSSGVAGAGPSGTLTLTSGTSIMSLSANAAATTVNIGTGPAVVKTINVGGTGANVIAIGDTQTAGSVAVGSSMTTGTISIGGTGLQTGTVSIAPGTGVQTVNIATGGTGAKTVHIADGAIGNIVTVGSTTAAASLNLQAGTGGMTLHSPAAQGVIITNGTQAPGIFVGTGSPNTSLTAPKGSLFLNVAGSGVNDRAFINTDGTTAWTAVVTVA